MINRIIGKEGEYLIKNASSILQFKYDNKGNYTGKSIIHIITDSIENNSDRLKVSKKIRENSYN